MACCSPDASLVVKTGKVEPGHLMLLQHPSKIPSPVALAPVDDAHDVPFSRRFSYLLA